MNKRHKDARHNSLRLARRVRVRACQPYPNPRAQTPRKPRRAFWQLRARVCPPCRSHLWCCPYLSPSLSLSLGLRLLLCLCLCLLLRRQSAPRLGQAVPLGDRRGRGRSVIRCGLISISILFVVVFVGWREARVKRWLLHSPTHHRTAVGKIITRTGPSRIIRNKKRYAADYNKINFTLISMN